MTTTDPLDLFLPPVREWFRSTLGEPTFPQRLGWPAIASGRHTLILAPTGSGKTLASFLACLDHLWRQPDLGRGVRVLYVSPLKALNNDIHRNLQLPLASVAETAERMGFVLPKLEAAVRTGDTTTAERQRMIRRPPQVLITTPESLHLLLTSRGRETLRSVTHVIVDEIHALCTNKRGVFLSVLLERLEALQRSEPFVRIGLSATQRPLEEVARYLGGQVIDAERRLLPRPVTIVDGGLRKDLDLCVVNPVEQFGPLPEKSIWPSIYRLLGDLIREHRSTIVFANDRRAVERITSFLNEEEEIARAHHGSVDLERRREIEAALKEGRLPAVCATASLEMGIDMGAVDLVCQVASPGNVARALQRVGRAGHLVGQKSKGRFVPRMASDLLEQAVIVREMVHGRVEEIRVPVNCLDVLAQQIVAMTAMENWNVTELFALIRRAYPYRDLSPQAFETTLEMISGRYRFNTLSELPSSEQATTPAIPPGSLESLQPRVSWDRVHNRLVALPGTQQLALVNGGTIPDTGQYAAYLTNGTRIGELDEEFIYERRVGDTFLLGTNAWRVEKIDADRVIVTPAEGAPAIIPFWRGEGLGRSYHLGTAIGRFLRDLVAKFEKPDCFDWLREEFHLDSNAARSLHHHVSRQFLSTGCVPTERTLVVEASRDQLGDWQVIVLSPLGQRVHLGLRLAMEARLRQRLGYQPQCLHHDDGILFRLTDTDEPILDLFDGITVDNVETLIIDELADSALFALRFRQNAARSLLMPRSPNARRAPLWLQRLRGRDLLQVARRHPDFPVVVETFRECLHDHLDITHVKQLLRDIREGSVEVVERRAEAPSPFAAGLLFAFTASFLYQLDRVENDREEKPLDRDLLGQLLVPDNQDHLFDPRAIHQVERRIRGVGHPPRSPAEMAEWLRRLGDLSADELEGPMEAFLLTLREEGLALEIDLPAERGKRWIATEEKDLYQIAFGMIEASPAQVQQSAMVILSRYLDTHALVGLEDVLRRYPFERAWAERQLQQWVRVGRAVAVTRRPGEAIEYAMPGNLDQVQRSSLGLMRREVITCQPAQFCEFLLRRQRVHPAERRGTAEALVPALERLHGLPLPVELWEETALPARVLGYQSRWLDEYISGGSGLWIARGNRESGRCEVAFLPRGLLAQLSPPTDPEQPSLSEAAQKILALLEQRGAQFTADLARVSELPPSVVRSGLWELTRRSLVANDQFDVIRRGEDTDLFPAEETGKSSRTSSLRSLKRMATQRPEGRWYQIPWGRPSPEEIALAQCMLLLERYGIVARELAVMDAWNLPWRILYEVFSRLELTGEVRRGYFVEGLSGAQFALPEAAQELQDLHAPTTTNAPLVLVHSQDPANLYGAGAPFDVPLLDGGTRQLLRRAGNWVVLKTGRPVLLVEQQGKKLTALTSASRDEITEAVKVLPGMFDQKSLTVRHKVTVEEWNGQPVTTSEGKELLEAAGFVRDYQGMTLYAAWR